MLDFKLWSSKVVKNNKMEKNCIVEDKRNPTVEEFLKQELNVSLSEFTSKLRPWKLQGDLRVILSVKPEDHYEVSIGTIIKKGAVIRILGPEDGLPWQPVGYTNRVAIELFETTIALPIPLSCHLEHLVQLVK